MFTCDSGADDVIDLSILQRQVPDHGAVREQQLHARATDDGHAQIQVLQSEKCLQGQGLGRGITGKLVHFWEISSKPVYLQQEKDTLTLQNDPEKSIS